MALVGAERTPQDVVASALKALSEYDTRPHCICGIAVSQRKTMAAHRLDCHERYRVLFYPGQDDIDHAVLEAIGRGPAYIQQLIAVLQALPKELR